MLLKNTIKLDKENYQLISLSLLLVIVAHICLLYPGIPTGHDGGFHLSRISALKDAIEYGYGFPVKVYPNYFNGIDYGNGLFYPDILLYIPALISYLGINVITSYKIFLILLTIITIFSTYHCSKYITNSHNAALISTILYTLNGYRIYNIYGRFALGEVIAMTFIPITIYGIIHIINGEKEKFHYFILGLSCILLSHIISSVITIIFIGIYILFHLLNLKKDRFLILCGSLFIVFLLVSYFYIPLIEQLVSDKFILNTNTIKHNIHEAAVPIWEIFYDIPLSSIPHVSLKGISGLGILSFVTILLYLKNFQHTKENKIIKLFFYIFIAFIFLISDLFPWKSFIKIVPWFSAIQFPWRFYGITIFIGSVISGYVFNKYYCHIKRKLLLFIICISLINISLGYIYYIYARYKNLDYMHLDKYYVGCAEYLPYETNKTTLWNSPFLAKSSITTTFTRNSNGGFDLNYQQNNSDNTIIELPLIYYRGYKAIENNREVPISKNNKGQISIELAKVNKKGVIEVFYEGTVLQKIFNKISLFSLIFFMIIILIVSYNQKTEHK